MSASGVVLASLIVVPSAAAQDEEVEDSQSYASLAVQNRRYGSVHEITAFFGVLPLDAFTKGITLSGAYTIHFSELVAWEVVQFTHSFPVDTSLSSDLEAFDLSPTPFEIVENYVTSSLMWKPVYWKGAFLNDSVLYGELFLLVGGGYGWFTRSNRAAIELGGGIRLYTGPLISFRLEIRYLGFFDDSVFNDLDLHNELWTGLGVSLSL